MLMGSLLAGLLLGLIASLFAHAYLAMGPLLSLLVFLAVANLAALLSVHIRRLACDRRPRHRSAEPS